MDNKDKNIEVKNEIEANTILDKLQNSFSIESVDKKIQKRKSKMPYITSTMQQDASNKLGMNAKKTMSVAQKLYEGIELSDETVGLITYMRTDSVRLSNEFVAPALKYIEAKYGKEYVGSVKVSKKTENVQDAHEAIRPTSIDRDPLSVKPYLTSDEYKLYRMIYYRALASLMSDVKVENTSVVLNNNDYKFNASGQVNTFDGYLKIYKEFETTNDKVLPDFSSYKSSVIVSKEIKANSHFTEPPARFKEDTLIKELESLGIGRPSTYVKIIEVLKERKYISYGK